MKIKIALGCVIHPVLTLGADIAEFQPLKITEEDWVAPTQ